MSFNYYRNAQTQLKLMLLSLDTSYYFTGPFYLIAYTDITQLHPWSTEATHFLFSLAAFLMVSC